MIPANQNLSSGGIASCPQRRVAKEKGREKGKKKGGVGGKK